ncbi:MAG: DNA-protecting protein DprA [Actinobacteria bacterium]|nr:DNA-protecting protein DprA [Actinomycetota bacterium]
MNGEEAGYATALASLPGVGPSRLRVLLGAGEPGRVWDRIRTGALRRDADVACALGRRARELTDSWRDAAREIDPARLDAHRRSLGLTLLAPGDAAFPEAFRDDPDPPSLVWVRGDLEIMATPKVAIVGTRRCTRYGHDVARRFGADLSAAGVSVVSGLALGVDAAAHAGAASVGDGAAPPIGVVGTGLDVVYPRQNRGLWETVGERGLLISEAPPGAGAEPWRFPARNRLIAALALVVVVVESTERGGSLYTVDEAILRNVEVRAVPGPILSPASAGTNRLIADGAALALSASEVLESLGIGPVEAPHTGQGADAKAPPASPEERAVLDSLSAGAMTLDALADHTSIPLGRLGAVLVELEAGGRVVRSGGWYESAR